MNVNAQAPTQSSARVSRRHLILDLESPLMAFGGVSVDNFKPTRRFPGSSSLVGMIANALGWRRVERRRHARLQKRLVFAARIERESAGGLPIRDFQTGQLDKDDKGWTTSGKPEGRKGSPASYQSPALLYNEYIADGRVVVALRLDPEYESPTWEDVARALVEPARPLFIGRKSCLPSVRILGGIRDGATALDALIETPFARRLESTIVGALDPSPDPDRLISLQWPEGEGAVDAEHIAALKATSGILEYMVADERNWASGLHGGERRVYEGLLPASMFGRHASAARERMRFQGQGGD